MLFLSLPENRWIEGRHIKEAKEVETQNNSENERDSKAGGKVSTVITVTIRSAGGVNHGAETRNTSEHSGETLT